jgi:hypothetical protein
MILGILVAVMIVVAGIGIATHTVTASSQAAGCASCNGKCTATSNCGQASCGATQGKSCTCGK